MNRIVFERSSGGLVLKKKTPKSPPKLLMVQVKNLLGKIVWTFPKGHVEKGETIKEAALREVLEETGWSCKMTSKSRAFEKVQYFFWRGKQKVRKEVIWFLMKPTRKSGRMDPQEIRKTKWVSLAKAEKKVKYPSDKNLLKKLKKLT